MAHDFSTRRQRLGGLQWNAIAAVLRWLCDPRMAGRAKGAGTRCAPAPTRLVGFHRQHGGLWLPHVASDSRPACDSGSETTGPWAVPLLQVPHWRVVGMHRMWEFTRCPRARCLAAPSRSQPRKDTLGQAVKAIPPITNPRASARRAHQRGSCVELYRLGSRERRAGAGWSCIFDSKCVGHCLVAQTRATRSVARSPFEHSANKARLWKGAVEDDAERSA